MMTREKFKDLVYKMQEFSEFYDKLYELGIDVINCKYFEIPGIFFDEMMLREFGEENLDLITWWMYEDVDHVLYEAENENKIVADLNNIDDLYDYLTEGGRDGLNEEEIPGA
jgi:hypothetical protein